MVMHNLIPVLIFKDRYDVKTYFLPESVEVAKYDYWCTQWQVWKYNNC